MMDLNSIKPANGSTKNRKRIGRGTGSGHGKTSTKGHKGQKARSGGSVKAGFEGGQMPMQRRLPKRGFTPLEKVRYCIVKLHQLNVFDSSSEVTIAELVKAGIVPSTNCSVKVLACGNLNKPLTVFAHKFSTSAKGQIISAGGNIQELKI
jgi:large subunit ribosomal protein L15